MRLNYFFIIKFKISAARAVPSCVFHGYEFSVSDDFLHRNEIGNCRSDMHLPCIQMERVRSWPLDRRKGKNF